MEIEIHPARLGRKGFRSCLFLASNPSRNLIPPFASSVGAIAPPHNLDAEQSVLGAILISDRSLYAIVIEEGLRPEDFYRERHALV